MGNIIYLLHKYLGFLGMDTAGLVSLVCMIPITLAAIVLVIVVWRTREKNNG